MDAVSQSSAMTPAGGELIAYFPGIDTSLHGLRAIIVVRAELIRDTCGYAVPFMTYDEDRDLHAKRFAREDDESLNTELFSTWCRTPVHSLRRGFT
jgi:hypothetical protein